MSWELRARSNELLGDRSEGFVKRWHLGVLEKRIFVQGETLPWEEMGRLFLWGEVQRRCGRRMALTQADDAGGVERQ